MALNNFGAIYNIQGDIPKALEFYHNSLNIYEEMGDKTGMAITLNNIGIIYNDQGDIHKALECYHKSLKISEERSDKEAIATCLNNFGVIYNNQGEIPKALECYHKSLNNYKEMGNKSGMATALNNIGMVYKNQGDLPKALEFFQKSLKIVEEMGYKSGIASSLYNLGLIYTIQGDLPKALECYHKSLNIREAIGDKSGIAYSLTNIGGIELDQGELDRALNSGTQALLIAREIGSPELISDNSSLLSKVAIKQRNFKEAFEMYQLHIQMHDSINNKETQKAAIQQQFKYDYEKKEAVANAEHKSELERQEAVSAAEEHKQDIIIGSVSGGLGLVGLFSVFLFNRFRVTKRQKGIIEEQKEDVDRAYDSLEEKNKDITDSINYAQRIQAAILPPNRIMKQYLSNSFVLYKPKDIVAGDFYWIEPVGDTIIFAAADCTGHGVPGAMLSMLCNNALNRSVRQYGLTDPGKILDKTREIIIAEFDKSDEHVHDGMDISLCALNGSKLLFAGAYNPLWIARDNEIIEIKGDKQPIGNSDNPKPFTTHSFDLKKGDVYYIFSDGYVDQFGGKRGKKLKAKAFRELLLSVTDKPMAEKQVLLHETFENWRGDLEQVDDVCVIGVNV